jgi:TetR/AcrR family transcriptional regulator
LLTNWLVNEIRMTTEEHILQQAREIFYLKGLAGARMQEIADRSGINKAMLHYYFKTKELLFDKVFADAFEAFAGKIAEVLNSGATLEEKVKEYVNHTVDALALNPGIPIFVLNELTGNPLRMVEKFAGEDKINLDIFKQQVERQTNGKIDAEALFMDMVALCVYPFVMAPVFKQLLQKSDQQYQDAMQLRKAHIINELLTRLS